MNFKVTKPQVDSKTANFGPKGTLRKHTEQCLVIKPLFETNPQDSPIVTWRCRYIWIVKLPNPTIKELIPLIHIARSCTKILPSTLQLHEDDVLAFGSNVGRVARLSSLRCWQRLDIKILRTAYQQLFLMHPEGRWIRLEDVGQAISIKDLLLIGSSYRREDYVFDLQKRLQQKLNLDFYRAAIDALRKDCKSAREWRSGQFSNLAATSDYRNRHNVRRSYAPGQVRFTPFQNQLPDDLQIGYDGWEDGEGDVLGEETRPEDNSIFSDEVIELNGPAWSWGVFSSDQGTSAGQSSRQNGQTPRNYPIEHTFDYRLNFTDPREHFQYHLATPSGEHGMVDEYLGPSGAPRLSPTWVDPNNPTGEPRIIGSFRPLPPFDIFPPFDI